MAEVPEEEFSPTPPDADRVAARAMVLSAVSCRGLIEKDALDPGAEELRRNALAWLESVGAADEMEAHEAALLSTPLGQLDPKLARDATWRSEGAVVLAWALSYSELPPVHAECDPADVANALGFLDERANTALDCPRLRASDEIERWANVYLTLHWRLREYLRRPDPIDFTSYVSDCTWGPLRLDELDIVDGDLAIDGARIDDVEHRRLRHVLSITQERHQALNWLLGWEQLYSEVTTDT